MFIKYTFIVFSLIISTAYGRGDEVGNGSGLYKNRVTHIFQNLDQYINQTLRFNSLQVDEREHLSKIYDSYSLIKTSTKLYFQNEDDSFFIDGEYKIAYTGLNLNSPIYFNIDKLYMIAPDELSLTLISILVHEMGHKVGITDHFKLDLLGNLVSDLSIKEKTIYYTDIIKKTEFIEVHTFHDEDLSNEILYITEYKTFSLNKLIDELNICDGIYEAFNFHKNTETQNMEGLLLFTCTTENEMSIRPIQIKKKENSFLNEEEITLELI